LDTMKTVLSGTELVTSQFSVQSRPQDWPALRVDQRWRVLCRSLSKLIGESNAFLHEEYGKPSPITEE
jgi:hypothetical protein